MADVSRLAAVNHVEIGMEASMHKPQLAFQFPLDAPREISSVTGNTSRYGGLLRHGGVHLCLDIFARAQCVGL